MCFGGEGFLQSIGAIPAADAEKADFGVHPETGQERYPDRTYNEHSGNDYATTATPEVSGAVAPKKGEGLKGDAPLIDNKKEKGPTPGSSGGGEINY